MKERVETQHILLKNIAAERDRLKAINADLLAALETLHARFTDGRRGLTEDQLTENTELISGTLKKAKEG